MTEYTLLSKRIAALEKLSNERHIIQLTIRKAAKGLAKAEREALKTGDARSRGFTYAGEGKRKPSKAQMAKNTKLMQASIRAQKAVLAARHHLYMTVLDVPLK